MLEGTLVRRYEREVVGFDVGTLWHPLKTGLGHRFLEDDNGRFLPSDSGANSGCVARYCPPPRGDDNARSSIVGLDFPQKNTKNAGFISHYPVPLKSYGIAC